VGPVKKEEIFNGLHFMKLSLFLLYFPLSFYKKHLLSFHLPLLRQKFQQGFPNNNFLLLESKPEYFDNHDYM
jgi:hypothetical protein